MSKRDLKNWRGDSITNEHMPENVSDQQNIIKALAESIDYQTSQLYNSFGNSLWKDVFQSAMLANNDSMIRWCVKNHKLALCDMLELAYVQKYVKILHLLTNFAIRDQNFLAEFNCHHCSCIEKSTAKQIPIFYICFESVLNTRLRSAYKEHDQQWINTTMDIFQRFQPFGFELDWACIFLGLCGGGYAFDVVARAWEKTNKHLFLIHNAYSDMINVFPPYLACKWAHFFPEVLKRRFQVLEIKMIPFYMNYNLLPLPLFSGDLLFDQKRSHVALKKIKKDRWNKKKLLIIILRHYIPSFLIKPIVQPFVAFEHTKKQQLFELHLES